MPMLGGSSCASPPKGFELAESALCQFCCCVLARRCCAPGARAKRAPVSPGSPLSCGQRELAMSRTADEAPRSLTASLATALAAESEWARRFLGGDPDAWSAAESHCPRSRTVRISGVLGELDAFQPLAADGAVDSGLAIAQHLALSGLRAAASPCAGTLDFEYAAADVSTSVLPLTSGVARAFPVP